MLDSFCLVPLHLMLHTRAKIEKQPPRSDAGPATADPTPIACNRPKHIHICRCCSDHESRFHGAQAVWHVRQEWPHCAGQAWALCICAGVRVWPLCHTGVGALFGVRCRGCEASGHRVALNLCLCMYCTSDRAIQYMAGGIERSIAWGLDLPHRPVGDNAPRLPPCISPPLAA